MIMGWLVLFCLLSATIHSTIAQHGNHSVSPRAADGVLEALSLDLLHFLSLSVQLEVYYIKKINDPVDMQRLADRLSDLGVSFRELDEANVANLKTLLTAIGTGVESECSAGCALPGEVSAGFGLIEYIKSKEAEIRTALAATSVDGIAQNGKVMGVQNGLTLINRLITGTPFSKVFKLIRDVLPKLKTVADPSTDQLLLESIEGIFIEVQKLNKMHRELENVNDLVATITQADMSKEIEIVNNFKGLPAISDALDAKRAVLDTFKQHSATFSSNIDKIKTLLEKNNPEQVLTALKTLEKLNVGSKFLDYFDNSFSPSKWLKQILGTTLDPDLTRLKGRLDRVRKIGKWLDPLRTSVEDVNSWEVHHALLDIGNLLDQFTNRIPELSKATSEFTECIKNLKFVDFSSMTFRSTIDNLVNPENHINEFKQSLEKYLTDRDADWKYLNELVSKADENAAVMMSSLKDRKTVKLFTETLERVKVAVTSIKTTDVNSWLSKIEMDKFLADSKMWIMNSKILDTLECLASTNSEDSVKTESGVLPEVVKLGKNEAMMAAALKMSNGINTAIDLWKQLPGPQTRRRRAPPQSTPMDELIESTLAVRRLIRACSNGTLVTLLKGLPQLDPNVKSTFQHIVKACDELKTKAGSVQKVTDLTHLFVVLTPLGDTYIDAGKLADELELALTSSDPDVQQAVQDLKLLDLTFAKYDGAKVDEAMKDFNWYYGIHLPRPPRGSTTTLPTDPVPVAAKVAIGVLIVLLTGAIVCIAYTCCQIREIERMEDEVKNDDKKEEKKEDKKEDEKGGNKEEKKEDKKEDEKNVLKKEKKKKEKSGGVSFHNKANRRFKRG